MGFVGGYAAVVLAGGAGRRLAGADKPSLTVGAVSMLDRVLAAVADAHPRVVVGPSPLAAALPDGAVLTTEDPPGSGPVAATAAGLRLVPPVVPYVALLAADLPFLTSAAIRMLAAEMVAPGRDAGLRASADAGVDAPDGAAGLASLSGTAVRDAAGSLVDGALFVDSDGRRQLLCGLWRVDALRAALAALGDPRNDLLLK